MPNIAAVLKDEIARIARKETKRQVDPLRRQLTAQRRELAAMKRERDGLQRQLKQLGKARPAATDGAAESSGAGSGMRFSASGLQALRKRLGVSAGDFGKLVGVSGQSVYNWEHGKARPRAAQLARIAELRGTGKRAAQARLDAPTPRKRARRSGRSASRG